MVIAISGLSVQVRGLGVWVYALQPLYPSTPPSKAMLHRQSDTEGQGQTVFVACNRSAGSDVRQWQHFRHVCSMSSFVFGTGEVVRHWQSYRLLKHCTELIVVIGTERCCLCAPTW